MCYSQNLPDMKQEIDVAVNFLIQVVRLNHNAKFLAPGQIGMLREKMCEVLLIKYTNHWFPDFPTRGSGYRCIRINGLLDPLVRRAGELSGVSYELLRSLFPAELTLWVDPREVAYRFGENGSVCTLLAPSNDGKASEVVCDPYDCSSPRNRSSPTDYLLRSSGKRSPPSSPVGSPYNYMARSKKVGLAQRLEFTHNAKNITHLVPVAAYV